MKAKVVLDTKEEQIKILNEVAEMAIATLEDLYQEACINPVRHIKVRGDLLTLKNGLSMANDKKYKITLK